MAWHRGEENESMIRVCESDGLLVMTLKFNMFDVRRCDEISRAVDAMIAWHNEREAEAALQLVQRLRDARFSGE